MRRRRLQVSVSVVSLIENMKVATEAVVVPSGLVETMKVRA